ncbi:hypothetical protein Fbal_0201 [Ferrimonas balearica DSM 9799]|uniref:Uncharacterized protein n=1 Tax=Ferrimonas balearica (strain DSM 9799 / CCM 4581 / KCTC 23876 / PAT) TaxID=550540 RepID=E1SL21_FERBD|nr:hypothetical protein [Ferrimonas balearica]ADN74415.1 hypothetical protein Fbal_0201 [Ferrimonas balearica DSM 9799]
MFLVSNFPNVPIATSNPATESAQREAALRVPISRPEPLLKSAAERALDPERERSRIDPRQQSQQRQSGEEQEQSDQPPPQQGREGPLSWREALAQARPVMERPGSRRSHVASSVDHHPAQDLDKAAYARFEQIVRHHYEGVAEPRTPPAFEART